MRLLHESLLFSYDSTRVFYCLYIITFQQQHNLDLIDYSFLRMGMSSMHCVHCTGSCCCRNDIQERNSIKLWFELQPEQSALLLLRIEF